MSSLKITRVDGKWLVNGKTTRNLDPIERIWLNDFFREVKVNAAAR